MRQRIVIAAALMGTVALAAGCATKKFVREEVGKSEVKLEREVGRLEGDLGQQKSRLGGVTTQVNETRAVADEAVRRADRAAGVASEAGTRADDAASRAGQASTRAEEAATLAGQAVVKATETDGRLTRLWASRDKRVPTDTVVILFGFDRWELDDRAQTVLLDVVTQLQGNPGLVVDLEGYTDNVGASLYNIQLSERRVEAVRRYLVEKGVDLHRIHSIGLGPSRPVADNKTRQGRDQNRRVAVKLFAPAE
jgi:outer membrane protein OmpA-like peptidoglycan-associated protein